MKEEEEVEEQDVEKEEVEEVEEKVGKYQACIFCKVKTIIK